MPSAISSTRVSIVATLLGLAGPAPASVIKVALTAQRRIGGYPYLPPLSGSSRCGRRDGRGLGAAADPELGEDAADVVLGRLGADEQALADLGIGQAGAEELEHVPLALAETLDRLGPHPPGPGAATAGCAPATKKGRSPISMRVGTHPFEHGESGSRFGSGLGHRSGGSEGG